ncbi:MAG: hypothetical protein ACRC4N_00095, partial [Gammaproteobacteria bacterium]
SGARPIHERCRCMSRAYAQKTALVSVIEWDEPTAPRNALPGRHVSFSFLFHKKEKQTVFPSQRSALETYRNFAQALLQASPTHTGVLPPHFRYRCHEEETAARAIAAPMTLRGKRLNR